MLINLLERLEKLENNWLKIDGKNNNNKHQQNYVNDQSMLSNITMESNNHLDCDPTSNNTANNNNNMIVPPPPPPPPPPPAPLPPTEFKFCSTPNNPVFKAKSNASQQNQQTRQFPKIFNHDDDDNDNYDADDPETNFLKNKKQRFANFRQFSFANNTQNMMMRMMTRSTFNNKKTTLIEQLLWNFVSGQSQQYQIFSNNFTYSRLFLEDLIQQRKLLRKITRNSQILSLDQHERSTSFLMDASNNGKHLNDQSLNEMLKTALKRKFATINNQSSTLTLDESQFSDRTNDFST